jgi:hypothetical protein
MHDSLSKGITCVGIWEHTGAWKCVGGVRIPVVYKDHINKPKSLVALGDSDT